MKQFYHPIWGYIQFDPEKERVFYHPLWGYTVFKKKPEDIRIEKKTLDTTSPNPNAR